MPAGALTAPPLLPSNDPMRKTWHEHGFDSAWSPEGVNGKREEHCVRDPKLRIRIVDVILGNTREGRAAGFAVACKRQRNH